MYCIFCNIEFNVLCDNYDIVIEFCPFCGKMDLYMSRTEYIYHYKENE